MTPLRFWFALVPAMSLPCIASLFYFVLFQESAWTRILYSSTKLFTLVWPIVVFYWIWQRPFPKFSLQWNVHLHSLFWGLLTGCAIVFFMFGILQTPLGNVVYESTEFIRKKSEQMGILEYYWAFALFLSLIHSLLEEYYWRWFVFKSLREYLPNVMMAHLLAGVAFASHHIVVTTQFFPLGWGIFFGSSVGVGGILWSVMYEKQHSLLGCWISHLLVDLGIFTIGHKMLFGRYF
ncbi:MAG: CPBP family intramembrane glutamic endopeptidase [Planctomycetota bacterium]